MNAPTDSAGAAAPTHEGTETRIVDAATRVLGANLDASMREVADGERRRARNGLPALRQPR